jgi:hypothetical protein
MLCVQFWLVIMGQFYDWKTIRGGWIFAAKYLTLVKFIHRITALESPILPHQSMLSISRIDTVVAPEKVVSISGLWRSSLLILSNACRKIAFTKLKIITTLPQLLVCFDIRSIIGNIVLVENLLDDSWKSLLHKLRDQMAIDAMTIWYLDVDLIGLLSKSLDDCKRVLVYFLLLHIVPASFWSSNCTQHITYSDPIDLTIFSESCSMGELTDR